MWLLVVAAGPNKVLTFAGGPVVYEREWNQIPIARRDQPYMSAIAGIIHDSSASSNAVFRVSLKRSGHVQAETRWCHSKHLFAISF